MSRDPEHELPPLSGAEGAELITSAQRQRDADTALATAIGRSRPSATVTTRDYLDHLGRRAPMSGPAERRIVAAAQSGDPKARARLVEAYTPLIAAIARVYRDSPQVERLELLQEGAVGLLRALERYDPDRGVPFWGYATFWVRQAMQQLVAELTRPVVLSDRALRHLARIKDAHRSALQDNGREPGRTELAARSGLTPDQVESLLATERPARSTDEPLAGADGAVGTFGELLVDPLAEGEYERVLEAIEAEQLRALLSGLSDREREILRSRYGVDGDEQSLRTIGGRLGLSAERVRQIEERALGKLAAAAGDDP